MSAEAEARSLVAAARTIVALTGAGISAESGVPTFRGGDGLWGSFRPEDLATPEAFDRDPRLVWEWYSWRREHIAACVPNAAHLALAKLALDRPNVRIITQNVDDLHADAARATAGSADPSAAMPLELHGSIFRDRCTMCAFQQPNRAPVDSSSLASLPRCEQCGALLRPDVVWFGESLFPGVMQEAHEWAARADVCLVIGTSAVVQPAARISLSTRAGGGAVVEVNPEATPLTDASTISLRARAADIIPRILSGAAAQ
jgi:NAD-dependent deacetylase